MASYVPNQGNPQMTQSSVVVNLNLDRRYLQVVQSNASRSDATKRFVPDELKTDSASLDNFNVMPREVAVAIRPAFDDVLQRSPASYRARELNIFTCANHMPILYAPKDVGGATDAAKKAHLMRHWLDYARSQIVFVGCPLTQVLYDEKLRRVGNDKVPVQISGSTTLWNTGPYDIHAMDVVLLDVPHDVGIAGASHPVVPPGLPATKRVFWTVPLRDASHNGSRQEVSVNGLVDKLTDPSAPADRIRNSTLGTDDSFKRILSALYQATQAPNPCSEKDFTEGIKRLLAVWNSEWAGIHNRVIGIALKGASPGQVRFTRR